MYYIYFTEGHLYFNMDIIPGKSLSKETPSTYISVHGDIQAESKKKHNSNESLGVTQILVLYTCVTRGFQNIP